MEDKLCSQLKNLPKDEDDCWRIGLYICKITGESCIASSYENHDPGHPASTEVAEYLDYIAEDCPAYNLPDELASLIKKVRAIAKIDAELE